MKKFHPSSRYTVFLLLIAAIIALVACPHVSAQSANVSSWEEMIKKEKMELDALRQNVKSYIAAQPKRITEINEKTQQLNRELLRLSITYNMVDGNPVEMRDILRQITMLRDQGTLLVAPVKVEAESIAEMRKALKSHQAEYESLAKDDSLQEARKAAANHAMELKETVHGLDTALGILDILPNSFEQVAVKLEPRRTQIENDLRSAWKKYFLQMPAHTFFSAEAWKMMGSIFKNWLSFWDYWLIPYSQNRAVITKTVTRTILFGLAVFIAFLAIIVHFGRKYRYPLVRRLLPFSCYTAFGIPLLAVGVAASLGTLSVLSFVAEIIVAAGLVSISWNLRRIFAEEPLVFRHNPLWPIWVLFAAGMLAQICHVLVVLYSVPMMIIFVASGVCSRMFKGKDQNKLDAKLFAITSWLCLIFAGLTFFGMAALAVLVATVWFAVALNIELWSGLAGWLRKIQKTGEEASPAARLVQGVVFPMLFLGLFVFTLVWLVLYVGGIPLLAKIVDWRLDIGYLSINLPMLIVVIAMFFITRSLVVFVNTIITLVSMKLGQGGLMREGVVKSIHAIATYVIWSLFILLSLKLVGVGVTHLAIVAGGLSIGAGFGLQELIKNFFSGLILLFGRSIHPGDEIQLGDIRGTVIRVNIRNTIMQTNDDSTIFIPNSDLINKDIVNWTYRDPKGRAEIAVAVAYGSNTDLVRELLLVCARSNSGVLDEPPPYVLFWDFGDNALAFRLRYWIRRPVQMRDKIASAIRFEIERTFREHNIEMAYPQRDIHIRTADGLNPYLKP